MQRCLVFQVCFLSYFAITVSDFTENHAYLCKFAAADSIYFENIVHSIFKSISRAVEWQRKKRDGLFHAPDLVSPC